jgi:hypothetical protein
MDSIDTRMQSLAERGDGVSQHVDQNTLWVSRWAEEMLERSKLASLTVAAIVGHGDSRELQATKSALTRISRIRHLSLRVSRRSLEFSMINNLMGPNPLTNIILTDLNSPAPLLERLYLDFKDSASVHVLPQHIFARRLRELVLFNCHFMWNSPVLHGLRILKVTDVPPATRP